MFDGFCHPICNQTFGRGLDSIVRRNAWTQVWLFVGLVEQLSSARGDKSNSSCHRVRCHGDTQAFILILNYTKSSLLQPTELCPPLFGAFFAFNFCCEQNCNINSFILRAAKFSLFLQSGGRNYHMLLNLYI